MIDWWQWPGRLWRAAATVLAYACFGFGGVFLWWVVLPLQNLFLRGAAQRQASARNAVQTLFRLFVWWMRVLGLISCELVGREKLQRRGLLILANHPTLIDVVFLIGLVPNASCVVKSALATHPCMGGAVRSAGYICNNQSETLFQACLDTLSEGSNLIIFPEGTRSRPGQALKMQRGAAQLALRGRLNITPVRIRCEPLGLYKGQSWWSVSKRPLKFVIEVGDDLNPAPFLAAAGGEHGRAARHLSASLVTFFNEPVQPNKIETRGSYASAGR